jgi:hypothetical protein
VADFAAMKADGDQSWADLDAMDTRKGLVADHYRLIGRIDQISDQLLNHIRHPI